MFSFDICHIFKKCLISYKYCDNIHLNEKISQLSVYFFIMRKDKNMLLKFSFKNFKSFRNEVTLDLTATKITEHSDRNFEVGNVKVLPVACIIGANASGKSNVMEAFSFMCGYIIDSLNFAGGQVNPDVQNKFLKPVLFLFDSKSRNDGTKFEIYFSMNDDESEKIYQYGFVFKENIIEEEWLNYKSKTSREDFKTIFYRGKDENDFSGLEKDKIKNIEVSIQKETLILTLGAKLNESLLLRIYKWVFKNASLDFGNVAAEILINQTMGVIKNTFNDAVRKDIVEYLSSFDNAIKNIDMKEVEINQITKQKLLEITFSHKLNDKDEYVELPYQIESSGTQKMLALYPFLKKIFENGGVIFIDELNSKLHPLLLRTIIQMFLNKNINKNKAQLVFTSHDVWQLKSDILRRDEIWFTEKNDEGVSNLYSLSDFVGEDGEKIRKDEDFQKNYLMGKYGAIPNLKGFDRVFK